MPVAEISAKSILRKQKRVDSWFISFCGMNLYRGCTHNCAYCDGRHEKYNVNGVFERDIEVKINAPELLKKELNPSRKNAPNKKGFILLGGGVNDSYQPIEKKYEITRQALEILAGYGYPVHILTKSVLIKRDFDLIKRINEKSKVLVSFSISSTDDKISRIFESGASLPSERLEALSYFRRNGINGGIFYMPVIPFVTDKTEIMDKTLSDIKSAGAQYIVSSGMTLKAGEQKEHFFKVLSKYNSSLIPSYNAVYKEDIYGSATSGYYNSLNKTLLSLNKIHKIPLRIPLSLFSDILNENDRISVILDQLDYLLKLKGNSSPYGFAAYSISQMKLPVSEIPDLRQIKGVGPVTEKLIREIIKTGTCNYYEKEMRN